MFSRFEISLKITTSDQNTVMIFYYISVPLNIVNVVFKHNITQTIWYDNCKNNIDYQCTLGSHLYGPLKR